MKKDIKTIANLISIASRNSTGDFGKSFTEVTILDEAEKDMLVEEMFQMSDSRDEEIFVSKGEEIDKSDAVILLGAKEHPGYGIDCKACGFDDCESFEEAEKVEDILEGPNCTYRMIELGIAIGAALKTAGMNSVDAEIMVHAGLAAKHLGLSTSKVCIALSIFIEKSI